MKKTLLGLFTLMLCSASFNSNAQVPWELSGGSSGYVTTHTLGNCDVDGNLSLGINMYMKGWIINMNQPGDLNMRSVQGASPLQGLQICANTATNNGSSIQLNGGGVGNPGLISYTASGVQGVGHHFLNYDVGGGLGGWHSNMTIANNGQVTVGHDVWNSNALPGDILTVKDQLGFYSESPRIHGNSKSSALSIKANGSTAAWDGPVVEMWGPTSARDGQISHYSYTGEGSTNYYGHMFLNYNAARIAPDDFRANMCINKDGKVVIGNELIYSYNNTNPAPGDYMLYVQRGILTEKVKVAVWGTSNWSDFVFNENYNLKSLSDVESYIKENKHLPEIPSAAEVVKDGIDIASMEAKLLQKIEELTLYAIQQQKEIDELKNQIKK